MTDINPLWDEEYHESPREIAEARLETFITWAQSIFRELKNKGKDFAEFERYLTNYRNSIFAGEILPHNWDASIGSLEDAWNDQLLLPAEESIRDILEDLFYDYVTSKQD